MRVAAGGPDLMTAKDLRCRGVPAGTGRVGVLAYCGDVEAASNRRPSPVPAACAGEWE